MRGFGRDAAVLAPDADASIRQGDSADAESGKTRGESIRAHRMSILSLLRKARGIRIASGIVVFSGKFLGATGRNQDLTYAGDS